MANGLDPSVIGEWKTLYDVQLPNGNKTSVAHACLLRTGKVLFIQEHDREETIIWDPSSEASPDFSYPDNQPDNQIANPQGPGRAWLWCSGHSFLSDGTLLVCGGGGNAAGNALNTAWKFNPVAGNNGMWARTSNNMVRRRWYPAVLTLEDGRHVMVTSGLPSTSSVEIYDATTDSFTEVEIENIRDFPQIFPGLHLLPDGHIFYSKTGYGHFSGPDPHPNEKLTNSYFTFTGTNTGKWTEIPETMQVTDRREGMSVLLLSPTYPWVRVVIIGGTGEPDPGNVEAPSNLAEIINLSSISPHWESPREVPGGKRHHANAVLLPDNSIFVCGGTDNLDEPCALFNPIDNSWSEMASLAFPKFYHSVVILLPSGKVLATGGESGDQLDPTHPVGSTKIEIFSPPYLFKGPRPEIATVPESIRKGDGFVIETPNAAEIQKVVLVRPMAVTHQIDTEQRVLELNFRRVENELYVDTLTVKRANIAPNGYYMVFILNDKGVPSIAKFIGLQ